MRTETKGDDLKGVAVFTRHYYICVIDITSRFNFFNMTVITYNPNRNQKYLKKCKKV